MISKIILNKLKLFLIIMCGLFIFIPNNVIAATSPIQMEHKTNVPADKVWKIKFNQGINVDKLSDSVRVYNPIGLPVKVKISYDIINNTIKVEPPDGGYINGQTYALQIYQSIKDLKRNALKAPVTMNFTIEVLDKSPRIDSGNKKYNYEKYDKTIDQIVGMQSKGDAFNVVPNYMLEASNKDIYEYLNPKNFENHDYAVYQFLTLNYIDGITVEDVDSLLKGEGILEGQGKTLIDACKLYDVNPAYIIAHAILETGHGSSALAKGIVVNQVAGKPVVSKTTYNMFGIGAWDENPNKLGSERAYKEEWFTVEAAIEGGIKFVSTQYINNSTRKQNTLYKMRWNPESPGVHQYATDIAWAYKQSYRIKEILDKCSNASLIFEIPEYK
ncbi:N-acetylglucosaminidase [Clostridium tagluense]|uniref:N-acetylglucosaminidase n=1 Tax=Clostridium tagluense TaxID=360422 RepID=UPI001C6DF947|nr:glucosaminidase domain-containing protein [Clostridium tagluense]MBW9158377.1 glucosaminidase domain-containing protein [Clostridium tagluense]WLC65858.1 glucosaminidase domain-containing protein [Clostridium tagluense]